MSARFDKGRQDDALNIRLFQAASVVGSFNPPSGGASSKPLSHRSSLEQEGESDLSLAAYAKAWDTPCDSAAQKCVLLAIADRSDSKGFCWPSIKDICFRTGLSKSCVLEQVAILENRRVIEVSRKHRQSNRYQIVGLGSAECTQKSRVQSADGPQSAPNKVHSTPVLGPQSAPQPSVTVTEPSKGGPAPISETVRNALASLHNELGMSPPTI